MGNDGSELQFSHKHGQSAIGQLRIEFPQNSKTCQNKSIKQNTQNNIGLYHPSCHQYIAPIYS